MADAAFDIEKLHCPLAKEGPVLIDVTATPHGVRDALARVRATLTGWSVIDDDRSTTEMVLAEVLNNIVEHAYADLGNAHFTLILWRLHAALSIHVVDDGFAMPGEQLPQPRVASLNVGLADLPEGGFGWSLIWKLTEDLCYRRQANKNHLKFKIPLHSES